MHFAGQRRNYMQTRDAASIPAVAWPSLPGAPQRCNHIRGKARQTAFQPIIDPSTMPASRADPKPQEMCVPAELPALPRIHCLCREASHRPRKMWAMTEWQPQLPEKKRDHSWGWQGTA